MICQSKLHVINFGISKLETTTLPCLCKEFIASLQEMTLQLAYALTTSPVIRQSTFPATGMASPSALLVRMTLVLVQLPCRLRPIGPQHPQGVLPFWKIAQADWTTALTVAAVVESDDHPDDHLCLQGIVSRLSFLPPSMFNLVCYNLSATSLTMELTDPRKPHHQGVHIFIPCELPQQ